MEEISTCPVGVGLASHFTDAVLGVESYSAPDENGTIASSQGPTMVE
jgi:hypothetical protein